MTVTASTLPMLLHRGRGRLRRAAQSRPSSGSSSAAPSWPTSASTAPRFDQRIKLVFPDPVTGGIDLDRGRRRVVVRHLARAVRPRSAATCGPTRSATSAARASRHDLRRRHRAAPRGRPGRAGLDLGLERPRRATASCCWRRAAATPTAGSSSPRRRAPTCCWWATRPPCRRCARSSSSCPTTPAARRSWRCRTPATSRTYAVRPASRSPGWPARATPLGQRLHDAVVAHLGDPRRRRVEVAADEVDPDLWETPSYSSSGEEVAGGPWPVRRALRLDRRGVEGRHRPAPAPGQRARLRPQPGRLHGLLAPRCGDEVLTGVLTRASIARRRSMVLRQRRFGARGE